MSEILGFDSEGMQKGRKYVTFRTERLVPVVSIKWLEEYEKEHIHPNNKNF